VCVCVCMYVCVCVCMCVYTGEGGWGLVCAYVCVGGGRAVLTVEEDVMRECSRN